MKIESVDIKNINPAKYNPRTINNYEFSGLCESLKKFGLTQPLIVNKVDGVRYKRCLAKYENKRTTYFISEYGNVLSFNKNTQRVRILSDKKGGRGSYIRRTLGTKECYAHRLVAEHFVENNNPLYTQVRHLDGDSRNNFYKNLAWGDNSLNQLDRLSHNTDGVGEKNPMSKINDLLRQKAINLYYFEGLTPKEIKTQLNLQVSEESILMYTRNLKLLRKLNFSFSEEQINSFKRELNAFSNSPEEERKKMRKELSRAIFTKKGEKDESNNA